MNTPKTCPICGNSFVATVKHKHQKYCSTKCGGIARSRPAVNTCAYCKKQFSSDRQGARLKRKKYCSQACAGAASSQHLSIPCFNCGKAVKTHAYELKTKGHKYCSRACASEGHSLLHRGEQHSSYRGGSPKHRGSNWGKIRRAIIRRDGYKCQLCQKRLGRKRWDYAIHHIKPFRLFNGDYETANQLNNLIVLCRPCHGKVEAGTIPCPQPLL